MAVKFISHVEQDKVGGWYIKLTDTLEETDVICKDLDEYATQIDELGGEYGGDIEVVWTRSNQLSPDNYRDLEEKMAILQEKYQDEIDKINGDDQSSDDGFNPNV
ncbi:MAG: hypothetical protein KAJ49_02370 [Arcobacteraceae bacterium]|nr:hypothetical protein [Arcobacteraceae bacterium]